ncbi:MAG: hypothetical protein KME64_19465 [Scytonematopsis contorta HA4267-MV1]|nr:hypothetical protein [Scytonematopsis contorta HA4267-MV1]
MCSEQHMILLAWHPKAILMHVQLVLPSCKASASDNATLLSGNSKN